MLLHLSSEYAFWQAGNVAYQYGVKTKTRRIPWISRIFENTLNQILGLPVSCAETGMLYEVFLGFLNL
jgi:hypothetical protein